MRGTNGFSSARNGALVKALSEAVISVTASDDVPFLDAVGASDGRWFADDGIEIVNFGPGGGSEGHAADEFVLASELEQSAAIHVDFVGRLIGFAGRG
jgi:acetylornithine deacetylase/succinyl-diaminopimelate desuccinylase-like protein